MGFKRLVIGLKRRRDAMEDLMKVMHEKMKERAEILAQSPVGIVNVGDKIDGLMIDQRLFERYLIPRYQEYSTILHGGGKIAQCHMDGLWPL